VAECHSWVENTFRCSNFWLPRVVGGKFVTLGVEDLRRWDLIFFFPEGHTRKHGSVAVVHGVMEDGRIILGNLVIDSDGIKELERLNVTGKI